MSKKNPGIKIPYFRAEQYPVVEGFRCVEILIPDTIENMALLAGLLKLPGRAFNWTGDDEKRYELAQIWRNAYDATDWEQCMNCEELQDCIEPLLAAQTALFQAMLDTSKFGSNVRPGIPMTAEQRNTNLAGTSNPTCDLSITWAQCQQVIEYGDGLIKQGIALAESATNDLEILQVFTALPVIDELGGDAIAGYIETFLEGIADNYIAQASPTYIEQAQCAVFCACKADCNVTAGRIYEVFKRRVLEHFGTDPFTIFVTISDLFQYILDQDIDGDIIADTMMLVIFGGGTLAQAFLGDAGTKPLETLLLLAVNDANDDYLLLCEDCPPPLEWCKTWDFTIDNGGWQVFGGHGTYVPGVGWTAPGDTVLWLYREDFDGRKIFSISATTSINTVLQAGIPFDTLGSAFAASSSDTEPVIDVGLDAGFATVENMAVRCTIDGIAVWGGTCTSYTVCGFGDEPIWDS